MNDDDITKLAAKLTASLATKDDIKDIKSDIGDIRSDIKGLEEKIDDLDQKADTILQFTEAVDETTDDHEERLRNIEHIPVIVHELKNPKFRSA